MTTPTRRRTLRAALRAFVAAAVDRLLAAWRILPTAQRRLLAALAGVRPGRGAAARIRAAVTAFNQALAEFDRRVAAFAARWAGQDLPGLYLDGALDALAQAGADTGRWQWTARHQTTITTLTAQYYADLMGRLGEAVRRARAFLRAATDAARTPTGADPTALAREHPLDTVIYANAARHPVASWASAALSWQAAATANTGAATTAAADLGAAWVEIRDGAGCGWTSHTDPDTADGTLRTVADALAHPVAHAHCVRQIVPRPDLTGRTAPTPGPA